MLSPSGIDLDELSRRIKAGESLTLEEQRAAVATLRAGRASAMQSAKTKAKRGAGASTKVGIDALALLLGPGPGPGGVK